VAFKEVMSPSDALPKLVDEYFAPFTRDLENLVRKFCAHEPEAEQVRLVAQSIMALCVYWVIFQSFLPYVWPGFSVSEARTKRIADYVYELSLQALAMLEKSARPRISRR
jgi:hypothetical protein